MRGAREPAPGSWGRGIKAEDRWLVSVCKVLEQKDGIDEGRKRADRPRAAKISRGAVASLLQYNATSFPDARDHGASQTAI